jgi:hypothetical protein
VTVRTTSASPITWTGSLDLGGTTSSLWNGIASGTSGTVKVTGAAWNQTVSASSPTTFGYCAERAAGMAAAAAPLAAAPVVTAPTAKAKVTVKAKAKAKPKVLKRPRPMAAHHH